MIGIRGAIEGLYNGFVAAIGQPNLVHAPNPAAVVQPQAGQQAFAAQPQHPQFHNVNPPAPLDPQAQAPQDRFQQQLRAAYMRRQNADLALNGHQVRILDVRNQGRQDHYEDLQRRLGLLERRGGQRHGVPALPALPAFGINGPLANGHDANVGAGQRGGLAFGGHANRALGDRDDWPPAGPQRNPPRQ